MREIKIISLITVLLLLGCKEENNLTDKYISNKFPKKQAIKFAPELISFVNTNEYGGHFSPNGKEFYFTRFTKGEPAKIFSSKLVNNKWTNPKPISLMKNFRGTESCFSPDGKKFYYNREFDEPAKLEIDIFVSHYSDSLQNPKPVTSINIGQRRVCPSVSKNYNLYFSGNFDDPQDKDIYVSEFKDGKYSQPKNLGVSVNSQYDESHVYVSPDESYILFDSSKPGGFGKSDNYISFKKNDGSWAEAINLGKEFNSDGWDWYPVATPDEKYIIFARNDSKGIDMYWMKADIIKKLRKKHFNTSSNAH